MAGCSQIKSVVAGIIVLMVIGTAYAASPASCPAATSQKNEALAKRWVHDILQESVNDVSIVDDLVTDDYAHHAAYGQPTVEGREAYKDYLNKFFTGGIFSDSQATADQVVATSDSAVVRWTVSASYQGGSGGTVEAGTPVEWTGMTMMRIECGKIAEAWVEADSLSWLQQIGAVPRATP